MTTALWTRNLRAKDPFVGAVFEMEDADSARLEELIRRGVVALEKKQIDQAEKFLQRGLDLVPRNPWCRGYLAVCAAAAGRPIDETVNMALDVIEDHPDNPIGQFALGQIYLIVGRRGEAFQAFAKARQIGSRDRLVKHQLGRVDKRRPPVIASLDRSHVLNIICGRMRSFCERMLKR